MPGEDNIDVTLACVDPALVSCWDRMVKQGNECSLLLKHSKGKVTVTMQCTTPATPLAMSSSTSLSSSAKRKKKKGGKKRKLEKLLAYHQRLVVEKGLPPSRLMEEHAALSTPPPAKSSSGSKFECDRCDFASDTQRGLKVHMGKSHKKTDTEVLRKPEERAASPPASPILDSSREEIGEEKEEPVSPLQPSPSSPPSIRCKGCDKVLSGFWIREKQLCVDCYASAVNYQ